MVIYHPLQERHPVILRYRQIPSQLKEVVDRNIHKGTHQGIPQIPQLHTHPRKLVVYIFASQFFVIHSLLNAHIPHALLNVFQRNVEHTRDVDRRNHIHTS